MNKTLARLLSLLFHPLLVLTYALLLLMLINPYAFSVRSVADKRAMVLLLSVFSTSFMLPAFGVALMKPLGLIKTWQMEDKMERTGPYILSGVFYLWLYKNLLSNGQAPDLFATCALGATIGLFLAFFVNIFTKISAHAVGMGGLVAMLLLAMKTWGGGMFDVPALGGILQLSLNVVLAIIVVLAGLVGTARLALGAHEPRDLYRGYAVGIVAVLLAASIGV
jgi:membrane-associated phospholipid phosphatase